MSLREDFLAKSGASLPTETIEVPEIGKVLVRRMSGTEVAEYEEHQYEIAQQTDAMPDEQKRRARWRFGRALVVIHSARNPEDGSLIFSRDDLNAVADMDCTVLEAIYEPAARLSKLRESDREDAKKNSNGMPVASSGTVSESP